jgi:nitrite reductase/ring-hydroxylating ferredoxin subunit/uncharacterized membrane protein
MLWDSVTRPIRLSASTHGGCPRAAAGKATDVTSPLPAAVAEAVESFDALDEPAKKIGKTFRSKIPAGPVKDALSGTWMGHALHPLLTDIPIGTFTSALLCDLAGEEDAATKLIGAGLAAVPATVVTGWTDWADTEPGDAGVRRAGILHAAFNGTASALMAASYVARRRGRTGRGKLYSLAGLSLLGAGGWLGGHLSYAQGVGVDNTVFDAGPQDWTATDVRAEELVAGQPRCGTAAGTPVLLVRTADGIKALHNTCSHRGGSLADGELRGGTIKCPLHDSVFALDDGSVVQGPAAYPQPLFEAREYRGRVQVRRIER